MTFRPEDHTYWDDAGRRVPSVSEILRAGGLCGDGAFYAAGAKERGSRVHLITEERDRYGETLMEIDDEVAPYIAAYRTWKKSPGLRIASAEVLVEGNEGGLVYAGRADRVVEIVGLDGLVLVDIKTGAPAPWHRVQLFAYASALACQNAAALYLDKSGAYRVRVVSSADMDDAREKWAGACAAWRSQNE